MVTRIGETFGVLVAVVLTAGGLLYGQTRGGSSELESTIPSLTEKVYVNLSHSVEIPDSVIVESRPSAKKSDTVVTKPLTSSEFTNWQKSLVEKRAKWIRSKGLEENYDSIREMITGGWIAKKFPARFADSREFMEVRMDSYSQELATIFQVQDILQSKARGIDVLKAYISPSTLQDWILRSEALVVASFVSGDVDADRGDGYLSTMVFEVVEELKGTVPSKKIYLRQTTGIQSDSTIASTPGEVVVKGEGRDFILPAAGTRFLLSVSQGIYPLRVLQQGRIPANHNVPFSVDQATPMRIEGDSLVRISEHGSILFGTRLSELREEARKLRLLTRPFN